MREPNARTAGTGAGGPRRAVVFVVVLVMLVSGTALGLVGLAGGAGAQDAPTSPPRVGGQVGGPVGGTSDGPAAGGGKGARTGSGSSPQPSTPQAPTTPVPTRGPDVPASTTDGPPWALVLILGGLFGVLIGIGMGVVIGRASKRGPSPAAVPAPAPVLPPAAAPVPAPSARADQDRGRLVAVVVDVRDQIESPALREWLRAALADVGVAEVVADGQPFDPQRHQAVDHVPAGDPNWNNVVARTDRPGYTDRGAVLRLPQVAVYRVGA